MEQEVLWIQGGRGRRKARDVEDSCSKVQVENLFYLFMVSLDSDVGAPGLLSNLVK